jgi:hypothetical protein
MTAVARCSVVAQMGAIWPAMVMERKADPGEKITE